MHLTTSLVHVDDHLGDNIKGDGRCLVISWTPLLSKRGILNV